MRRPDPGVLETEKIIKWIEADISREYAIAHKEVQAKLNDYLRRFEMKDRKWQEWRKAGKKTKEQYRKWERGQVFNGRRWQALRDQLARDYANAAAISQSIAKEYAPDVYAINHNFATYEVEHGLGVNTSYTLYSRETVERMYRDDPTLYHAPGKDMSDRIARGEVEAWEKQRIQSVITQGILQGESIPNFTKRLESVTGGEHKAAIRNARTMMTGVQNAGRVDAYKRAAKKGIKVRKQWLATLDSRTRHEHRQLDGEIVDNDEPFENSIGKIMYPGDPDADGANVYNCRCTLIASLEGFEEDTTDIQERNTDHFEHMSYEEWKKDKKEKSNPIRLPEKKAAAIRAKYIKEYRDG